MCMHYAVGDAYQPDRFSDPISNISDIKSLKHKTSDDINPHPTKTTTTMYSK